MTDTTDMELLREYARQNSEAAFAELVRRHVNLVYSAALRHVGMAAQAEEISQAVFVILARKAARLREGIVLEAWLFETTRLTALSFLRGERRRQFREQEAYMQSTLNEFTSDPAWQQLSPLLDEAMMKLARDEREAVVLRFFKERSLGEVAAALNIKEPAAQKRVSRALEKLQKFFLRRGVDSTTDAIAVTVAANSVHAAPASLAKTISTIAFAKGAAASTSTLTLVKGTLKLTAWAKAKTAIAVGIGILVAATATTTVTVKEIRNHQNDEWQLGGINAEYLRKPPYRTVILPTKAAQRSNNVANSGSASIGYDRAYEINVSVEDMLRFAFGNQISQARTVLTTELPARKYDFFTNLQKGSREALQAEIRKKFGVTAEYQTIETNVLLLEVKSPHAAGLKLSKSHDSSGTSSWNGEIQADNDTLDGLAIMLELNLGIPVVNQTGLTNGYGFTLRWDVKLVSTDANAATVNADNHYNQDGMKQALTEQLGLELVPTNMPIQMLVIEKAQ